MNQQFEEDRAELEAHFDERVQAYIELGETPEQAALSARAKFGEVQAVMRELERRRRVGATLRRLRGVAGMGFAWGVVWGALILGIASILSQFYPDQFDRGESPIGIAAILGGVGLVSGSVFGGLLALIEGGKSLYQIPLARAALWGMLGSAAFPLLTGRGNQMIWTCPLGAIVAVAFVWLARRAHRDGTSLAPLSADRGDSGGSRAV